MLRGEFQSHHSNLVAAPWIIWLSTSLLSHVPDLEQQCLQGRSENMSLKEIVFQTLHKRFILSLVTVEKQHPTARYDKLDGSVDLLLHPSGVFS